MSETTLRAQRYLEMAGVGVEALEVIRLAVQGMVSKGSQATLDEIMAVLHGVVSLSEAVNRGLQGTVTASDIRARTQEFRDRVASSNQKIDNLIDQKFDSKFDPYP